MRVIDIEGLKQDKEDMEQMLAKKQQELIEAQTACTKIEGALIYNAQCLAFVQTEESDEGPPPPPDSKPDAPDNLNRPRRK